MIRQFDCMDDVLYSTIQELLRDGHAASPRGMKTRELLGVAFRINNPRARKIHIRARRWKEALAVGELAWHFAASDDVRFISYYAKNWAKFSDDGQRIRGSCYGKKIFSQKPGSPSQWETIKAILRRDRDSRRAVITLSDTDFNLETARKDIACISSIQFLIRDEQLHCLTTMRSNDVIWGLCYDVFVATMLQERLACELSIELGWYQHSSGSMHIYDVFLPMAKQIVNEGPLDGFTPMDPMEDAHAILHFLAVEKSLRCGEPEAPVQVLCLPPYWRKLTSPLLELYNKRLTHKKSKN